METASTGSCDNDLVGRSLQARDAFEAIVDRYHGMVYAIAYARLGDRDTAEEAVQETFLRAYLALGSLKQPDRLSAWLSRIARNVAEDWRRKRQTRSQLAAMVPLDAVAIELPDRQAVSPRDLIDADREAQAVREAVRKLPTAQREVVLLHFLEGLSKTQIAERFGVYPSAIGRKLERALDCLRRELTTPVPQMARAVAPPPAAVRRTVVLIAAAVALPHASRAALAQAAAAGSLGKAILTAAAHSGSPASKLVATMTYGGKSMLIIKSVAVVGTAAAIVTGGIHHGSKAREADHAGQGPAITAQTGASGQVVSLAGQVSQGAASQADQVSQSQAARTPASAETGRDSAQAPREIAQAPAATRTPGPSGQTRVVRPDIPGAQTRNAPSVAAVTPDPVADAVREKLSRTRSDMRTMAVAIESYFVDCNSYPPSDPNKNMRLAAGGEAGVPSFAGPSVTTPIAYITTFPGDSFSAQQQPFVYHAVNEHSADKTKPGKYGWILISPGPDGKIDIDWKVYDPDAKLQPQPEFVAHTYDPTNGIMSAGDVIRIKQ